ncbi:MAG: NAD(P) transhydrogenase subunit alpha [Firmicutes bacterium]|nr:NAD(P) transhydrogenase subunit alpha [Bacillota bacterium]
MTPIILIIVFVVALVVGYRAISSVPSLLHTPLMSGMNALSGVVVLGALVAFAMALTTGEQIFAIAAIILAMVNLVGGFVVTDRMLRMFKSKEGDRAE